MKVSYIEPLNLHSFAYESPTNCFEVTIKRTIDFFFKKGLGRQKTPGRVHLKAFYIFDFIFLNKEKGTKSYTQTSV